MGEKTSGDNPEPCFFDAIQERKARCTSELGRARSTLRALLQATSDDSLNQNDISFLQRIDRLDNILLAMEDHKAPLQPSGDSFRSLYGSRRISLSTLEKLMAMEDKTPLEPSGDSFRSLNGSRRISLSALEKHCKSTEFVLEEVEEKGTLVERVSELEKRLTKLQEMIITKSKDNVALHSIPSYNQTSHNNKHEESLQDDVDVEKHKGTLVSSAHLAPTQNEQHHEPPFTYSKKFGIGPLEEESSKHMEGQQGQLHWKAAQP